MPYAKECREAIIGVPKEIRIEEKVLETIKGMEWVFDYCIAKLSMRPYNQEVDPEGWTTGGDDSTYDYIPNGVETIAWLAKIISLVVDPDINEVEFEKLQKERDLPLLQDCFPFELRDKFVRLAGLLGYDQDDLVEAGLYEFEATEGELFDWGWIKNELNLEHDEPQEDEDGQKFRSLFLGTVMSLTPSGKYYLPFACSNVTENEAKLDELWRERLEAEAEKRGLFVFNGEGDPCDIFVGKMMEEELDDEDIPTDEYKRVNDGIDIGGDDDYPTRVMKLIMAYEIAEGSGPLATKMFNKWSPLFNSRMSSEDLALEVHSIYFDEYLDKKECDNCGKDVVSLHSWKSKFLCTECLEKAQSLGTCTLCDYPYDNEDDMYGITVDGENDIIACGDCYGRIYPKSKGGE